MDADVQRYLGDVVAAARGILRDDLVGAYAAGSVGLDAYVPGRSDIDVALVCEHALAPATKRELVARLRHEAIPCPARGLELVVYRRDVARSGTPEPGFELELNTGTAMAFRATYAADDRPPADGRFWYALDRSILHQSDHVLLGPPPAQVFADLSPGDLRRLLIDALTWWFATAPGTEDGVLGACRALVRYRHGVWLSKTEAGRRLVETGEPAALIERSIAARTGGPPPSAREASAFQQRAIDEIRAGPPPRHGP